MLHHEVKKVFKKQLKLQLKRKAKKRTEKDTIQGYKVRPCNHNICHKTML